MYGEKRISSEIPGVDGATQKIEYRIWNPFRSKLAASILSGVDNIHIKPGLKVLYLGAASGTSVSHVSDIVGPEGTVFAVEFSHRSGEPICILSVSYLSYPDLRTLIAISACSNGVVSEQGFYLLEMYSPRGLTTASSIHPLDIGASTH